MRGGIAAGVLAIASLTPFWLQQDPPKSAPPAQNPQAVTRPKTNPIPDQFTNLKVLPKDITKGKLVDMMKQFAITFQVRCSYCHAVSDDLTEGSFDSDEKPAKVKARELIKAIQALKVEGGGSGQ